MTPSAADVTPGAFVDKASSPSDGAVEEALGGAIRIWSALRAALAAEYTPLDEGWTFSGRKAGWALRIRRRDRAIVYLTPLNGAVRASLALPERAVPAVLAGDLPDAVKSIVEGARSYPEGRAIRLGVRSQEDVESVLTLARIRMAS